MNPISITEAENAIQKYLTNLNERRPFFVLVDDAETYKRVIDIASCDEVRVSDYCNLDDSFPDMDSLYEDMENMEPTSRKVLLGLGETLSLQYGAQNASTDLSSKIDVLGQLKDLNIRGKLIVICRSLYSELLELSRSDRKFNAQRWLYIQSTNDNNSTCQIIQSSFDLNVSTINGYKNLLHELENGATTDIYVKSELPLCGVKKIESSFDALMLEDPHFQGVQSWLSDEQWEEYRSNKKLNSDNLDHWRYFLNLKLNGTQNEYLQHVAGISQTYEQYKMKIYDALLDFSRDDPAFPTMYSERKKLLKNVSDGEISAYVQNTQIKDDDRMYYLTDNTKLERQAIIDCLKNKDISQIDVESLKEIYLYLYWYLSPYKFTGVSNEFFDDYFYRYRFQKVTNCLFPDFLELVNQYSQDGRRLYNQLDTRGSVVERYSSQDTILFWLDALGVEFLPFIRNWAKEKGLNMTTRIVRTDLPTITSQNRGFYDDWKGEKRPPRKTLDEIKHKGVEGAKDAEYLEEELRVIEDVLDEIRCALNVKSTQITRVILVSDHGASRLAVLNDQENRCEMTNKGIHSGRCCPVNEIDQRPNCASEENGFWVLANYEMFKGGRKGLFEVHGGASLEEVIVPVIEFSLKSAKVVSVMGSSSIIIGRDKSATLNLFCTQPLINAFISWNGNMYPIERETETTYSVHFSNINVRAGKQEAEVWENDTYICSIDFTVEKGAARINNADDLFK